MWGNHNVLLVDVGGERWVADAGIGDGFVEPLRLREGPHTQGELTYRLEQLDPDTWRVHHHPGGSVASYDFRLHPRELDDFADRSAGAVHLARLGLCHHADRRSSCGRRHAAAAGPHDATAQRQQQAVSDGHQRR
jgi:arylamine N-acetyltransferase